MPQKPRAFDLWPGHSVPRWGVLQGAGQLLPSTHSDMRVHDVLALCMSLMGGLQVKVGLRACSLQAVSDRRAQAAGSQAAVRALHLCNGRFCVVRLGPLAMTN